MVIKEIPNCSNYWCDIFGNIYSTKFNKLKLLKASYCQNNFYLIVNLFSKSKGKNYRVHRLIFETFKHPIPKGYVINHINGVKDDNRLENLECVTHRQNMQCQNKKRNNKTGEHNITIQKGKYRVYFRINKKTFYYGEFKTLEEAVVRRNEVNKTIS